MIVAEPALRVSPSGLARVTAWARRHVPDRAALERNELLRRVAPRILSPSLWRFNRRSVPRGVALGIATSVLVPVAHMPAAAMLSVPLRAHLPTAVAVTIPSTFLIPATWWAAYRIGHAVLRFDRQVPGAPIVSGVRANAGWLHWLFAQAGPATVVGLLLLAVVGAALGYVLSGLAWRWRIARRWRRRHRHTIDAAGRRPKTDR